MTPSDLVAQGYTAEQATRIAARPSVVTAQLGLSEQDRDDLADALFDVSRNDSTSPARRARARRLQARLR